MERPRNIVNGFDLTVRYEEVPDDATIPPDESRSALIYNWGTTVLNGISPEVSAYSKYYGDQAENQIHYLAKTRSGTTIYDRVTPANGELGFPLCGSSMCYYYRLDT